MEDKDKQSFFNCLVGCAEVIGKELSKPAMILYWNSLKHIEIDVVVDAFNRHIVNPDSGQFMPKPADIIKLTSGSHLDSAMIAWTKVDKSIRCVGSHASIIFDDSIIMAVIQDMGGWTDLCSVTEDELPFKQNEFEKRYKAYRTTGIKQHPKKLIGSTEAYNLRNGYMVPPPTLCGDPDEARLVYESGSDSIDMIQIGQLVDKSVKKIEMKK